MQVVFYKFSKKMDSTIRPTTGGTTKTVELKEPSSLLNPVLRLKQGSAYDFNYCYIPTFNRYYFVTDYVSDHGFWVYHLEVDVLASWWDDFKDTFQYVTRSGSRAASWIKDTYYAQTYESAFDQIEFNGASGNPPEVFQPNSGYFVLGVINGLPATDPAKTKVPDSMGGVTYYVLSYDDMRSFMNYLVGDASYLDDNILFGITKEIIKEIIDPLSWISCCYYLPFNFYNAAASREDLRVGNDLRLAICGRFAMPLGYEGGNIAAVSSYSFLGAPSLKARAFHREYWIYGSNNQGVLVELPHHPQYDTYGAYMDDAPFTERILRTGYFGDIPLDTSALIYPGTESLSRANKIAIRMASDMFGNCRLEIAASNTGAILHRSISNVAIPVKINQVTSDMQGLARKEMAQLNDQVQIATTIGGFAGGIHSSLPGTSGVIAESQSASQSMGSKGNLIQGMSQSISGSESWSGRVAAGDVGSVSTGLGSLASDSIAVATHQPKHTSMGSTGAMINAITNWEIDNYYYYSVEHNTALVGRPLCESTKLSELTGFCKIDTPNIRVVAATITELRMIHKAMRDGFFIEV